MFSACRHDPGLLQTFKGKGSHFEVVEQKPCLDPRPTLEQKVRAALRSYLLTTEMLSPEDAPLDTLSVARRLGFNRKTIKKYGLDVEISRASERQARNGKM
jgi:hypothetical protein